MNSEKIIEIVRQPEFMEELKRQETASDVINLFKSKGIEINEDDVKAIGEAIKLSCEKGNNLNEEELNDISGGKASTKGAVVFGLLGAGIGAVVNLPMGIAVGASVSAAQNGNIGSGAGIGAGVGALTGAVTGAVTGATMGYKIFKWIDNASDKNEK